MSRTLRIRTFSFFLVTLLLLPTLAGARSEPFRKSNSPGEPVALAWKLFVRVFFLLRNVMEKEGSSLDPFGKPVPNPNGQNSTNQAPEESPGSGI